VPTLADMTKLSLLLLLAGFLTGCVTQTEAPSVASPAQTSAPAVINPAEVVVMWAEGPTFQTLGVYADGKEVGRLKRNRLLRVPLASGEHDLKVRLVGLSGVGTLSSKMKLQCQPGRRHYVLYTTDFHMTGVVPAGSTFVIAGTTDRRFQEIDEKRAREIMAFAGIY